MALGNDCFQHCGGGILLIFQRPLLRKCLARTPFIMLFITTAINFFVSYSDMTEFLPQGVKQLPPCSADFSNHPFVQNQTRYTMTPLHPPPHGWLWSQALWCYMNSQPISLYLTSVHQSHFFQFISYNRIEWLFIEFPTSNAKGRRNRENCGYLVESPENRSDINSRRSRIM